MLGGPSVPNALPVMISLVHHLAAIKSFDKLLYQLLYQCNLSFPKNPRVQINFKLTEKSHIVSF